LLEVAEMARSTFYYHIKSSREPDKYADTKSCIAAIYHEHRGRYGYRRITAELARQGQAINHKTVLRLMGECGIKCQVRLRKYRSYKGKVGRIAENLLNRDFSATAPNRKWVTDVTEFSLFGQKLYLSPIMDLYNKEIISYTISKRSDMMMVKGMLELALSMIGVENQLILHSDQGWHYQHHAYQNMLKEKGVAQSMSRKGNCLDNAAMESFFGLLRACLNFHALINWLSADCRMFFVSLWFSSA
jgi:transposase InsO family protein